MANELLVGVKIGAVLSGSFTSAFSSARGTSLKLGQVTDLLTVKHDRLGLVMAQAFARPSRNVGELNRQYLQIGRTIDELRLKQERLATSLARGAALQAERADLRGQAFETIGTGVAVGSGVWKSIGLAVGLQDQMRDIAITGEFSQSQEASLNKRVRESAIQWNQLQQDVAAGINGLVVGGIQNARALEQYTPIMAKAATATRASMSDLGSLAVSLDKNLRIGADGYESSINMLSYAGKRGQFEIRDMAKWIPDISSAFGMLHVFGKDAIAEIGASLQVARMGAGSNDEAANNFRNFLQKITAQDTVKDFANAGIDLQVTMANLRANGLTPVQSMLSVIADFLHTKGPAAVGQFKDAINIKSDQEREAALASLAQSYRLGTLFQDMQAMNFIRPALAHMGEMQSIKAGAVSAGAAAPGMGLIDKDFKKRMDGGAENLKAFKIATVDLGLTIGDALLPPLVSLIHDIKPVIQAFSVWAQAHPGVIKGVVGLVGGLLLGKLAFIGLRYGVNLVLSPFNALGTAITTISAKWTLLRGLWLAGRFAPLVMGLKSVGSAAMVGGRFLMLFGQGFLMAFGAPLMLATRGVLFLSRLLAGRLLIGLRLAVQAVFWLGRALLLNPIGLVVTGIGIAAYLVWKHWGTVRAAALAGWKWLVGLKDRFFAAGGDLINGLVGGITAKLGAARGAIVSLGTDIKSWFQQTLGIHSPSRVFMGFGDNIAQGAALGIGRSSHLASGAATNMARRTAAAGLVDQVRNNGYSGRAAGAGAGAGLVVHFSPTIKIDGGGADIRAQVQEALKMSLHDLERLMKRVQEQQLRRST